MFGRDEVGDGVKERPEGAREAATVLDAVAGRRMLYVAEARRGGGSCWVVAVVGRVLAPEPGLPAAGQAPHVGAVGHPFAARGGMVRCDRFTVDEINQKGDHAEPAQGP